MRVRREEAVRKHETEQREGRTDVRADALATVAHYAAEKWITDNQDLPIETPQMIVQAIRDHLRGVSSMLSREKAEKAAAMWET